MKALIRLIQLPVQLYIGLGLFLIPLFAAAPAWADVAPILLDSESKKITLIHYMSYYKDQSAKLTLAEAQNLLRTKKFTPPSTDTPHSLGFTEAALWVHFQYRKAEDLQKWLLQYDFALIDELSFYELQDGQVVQEVHTGDQRNFNSRSVPHHNFLFHLQGKAGEARDVFLRLKSNDIFVLPLVIWESHELEVSKSLETLLTGAYSGMILLMLLFSLILYLSFKETLYLYYALYMLFLYLGYMSLTGEGAHYTWPEQSVWGKHIRLVFTNLTVAFAVLFVKTFLSIQEKMPRVATFLNYFVGFVLLHSLASFAGYFMFTLQVSLILTSIGAGLALVMGGVLFAQGYRPARFFLLGWTVLTVGLILYTLSALQLIPWVFVLRNVLRVGATIEALVLLIALTDRFYLVQQEKLQAQHAIVENQENLIRQLTAMDEQKINFLSNMSHELLTPMNGILGLSQVLEDMVSSDEGKECLQVIQASGRRLVDVFQSVLQITSLSQKGIRVQEVDFALRSLLEAQTDLFKAPAQEKQISISYELAKDLPEYFYGNANGVAQILDHLLSNAVKFTDRGGVDIKVSGTKQDSEQWQLEIVVHDTGVGFPIEKFDLMCSPFTQNDPTSTRQYDGCGLGLSIVKKLTDQMNGDFNVESNQEGSSFKVRIQVGVSTGSGPPEVEKVELKI